jgi:hypothetical protein
VKTLFHDLLFPKDDVDNKCIPWTKMGGFLYTNEKQLLSWPSPLNPPTDTFDLNKLNEPKLKLLCKAGIQLDDWTEGTFPISDFMSHALIFINVKGERME